MDATTLRLILLVVGAVFLVGLYLWERHRAADGETADGEIDTEADADWGDYLGGGKREPNLGAFDGDDAAAARAEPRWDDTADDFAADSGATAAELPTGQGAATGAAADRPEPATEPVADPNQPLLVQLYVVSADTPFAGARILAAAERLKLAPGSMDIFHRQGGDNGGRGPLFSMANLIKPGSFPLDAMDDFETPGLALFTQLHGDPSDLMVFDELLHAARSLAEQLGGEVQERGRTPLSEPRVRALRGQVSALLQGDRATDAAAGDE